MNREKIHILKVTLTDEKGRKKGRPYRIIAVKGNTTLYRLAKIIVESFDFQFDHAFGFYDNLKNYFESEEGYELFKDIGEESRYGSVKKTKVADVFLNVGKKMLFLFDYGDEWQFIVELKKVEEADKENKYPIVLKAVGKAPPQYGSF